MNIFVEGRQGTPISAEEREWIESELLKLKAYREDYEQIDKDVLSCQEDGLTSFDRSVIIQCTDADIWGMEQTLKAGVVAAW